MILENFYFQKKKLDTIEDHHNKHTIEDQGWLPWKIVWVCLSAVF